MLYDGLLVLINVVAARAQVYRNWDYVDRCQCRCEHTLPFVRENVLLMENQEVLLFRWRSTDLSKFMVSQMLSDGWHFFLLQCLSFVLHLAVHLRMRRSIP